MNELLAPAALRISLALAGGLTVIVAAERRHLRELFDRTLFLRWRTWALAAPLFVAAALGPVAFAAVFVTALSLQALREYSHLTGIPRAYRLPLYAAGAISAPVAVWSLTAWRAMPPLLMVLATIPPLLRQDTGRGIRDLAYAGLGFAYIPWLLAYFLLVREHVPGGRGVLLALGVSVAASDVWAFVFGKMFGRHPLAPRLSPNKTVEGVIGNVIGAYAGFALMSFALPDAIPAGVLWSLPLLVAAGSVWGDLVESLLKRQFGVKDAGTALPGFGGLLDRIDSLLVVLPLAYTALVIFR
ncbi:MAG TPA: phosphatidate cytidylyltransferase [Actinomycetota bacterium]|jgi:phosphatidate cytidylyltransferase|nr:phosphatidate cytidylyltransferase [Actinomycetota bacterium]